MIDVHSRKVVGWALSRSLQSALPLEALERALEGRKPVPGLIHHADRGSQYASNDYIQQLEKHKMTMSMSRAGRPWENAYGESFMRTLKHEEINGSTYSDLADLEQHVAEFIDQFYNPLRLHSALQYRSPEEFEQAAKEPWVPRPYLLAPLSFPRHEEIYPDA